MRSCAFGLTSASFAGLLERGNGRHPARVNLGQGDNRKILAFEVKRAGKP
jgi:hypothetical protein